MEDQITLSEQHYGNVPNRPDMYSYIIRGKRGKIFSVLYTAAGSGLHPTVLMMHGIPGCERNFDLAQALRRNGFHVMTFHYSGSWGSEGDYSLTNDLEDAETVLDFLLQNETCGIDKNRIYAVGHSLGGFVCGQLTAHRSEIQAGVLLMPCDIGRISQISEENPELAQRIQDVMDDSAPWLVGTSGDALIREAKENSERFRLENAAALLAQKPLLCVTGSLDIYTPDKQSCAPLRSAILHNGGDRLTSVEFPTDHFFADYRLTVSKVVVEFLREQSQRAHI